MYPGVSEGCGGAEGVARGVGEVETRGSGEGVGQGAQQTMNTDKPILFPCLGLIVYPAVELVNTQSLS